MPWVGNSLFRLTSELKWGNKLKIKMKIDTYPIFSLSFFKMGCEFYA